MQRTISRLERLYFRLEAQHACFDWVFGQLEGLPGPVFELGLGKGRTYDHLRRRLPGRDIHVFERFVDPIHDCMPPEEFLVRGELADTLSGYVERFTGKVALAHSDIGDFKAEHNREMRRLVTQVLPPAVMPGGFILSDLDLEIAGFERLPLPGRARAERYHIYRRPPA
jgi:hypothetical protein